MFHHWSDRSCGCRARRSALSRHLVARLFSEENDEGHRASAEGIDVPIKVVLKKTDKGFYIKSVTEYDTLDIAKEESDGFK